jgi:hypothetical protein
VWSWPLTSLVLRSRTVLLYLQSPIHLHSMVPN